MTQSFTDSLLNVLPSMADSLGNALGIEQERQKVSVRRCCSCQSCQLQLPCDPILPPVRAPTASQLQQTLVMAT
jgi:hypothetical protein